MSGDKREGIYDKYEVARNDGADQPGHKHHGCALFVLDLTHDVHARRAAIAYVNSCRAAGFEKLADDLAAMVEKAGGRPRGRSLPRR
jgi:hypothetical protein